MSPAQTDRITVIAPRTVHGVLHWLESLGALGFRAQRGSADAVSHSSGRLFAHLFRKPWTQPVLRPHPGARYCDSCRSSQPCSSEVWQVEEAPKAPGSTRFLDEALGSWEGGPATLSDAGATSPMWLWECTRDKSLLKFKLHFLRLSSLMSVAQ